MASNKPPVLPVEPLPLDTPVYEDRVRFVCMSDTHCKAAHFADTLPPGDVFLHAGDFTFLGLPREVEDFNTFLGSLNYRHKIVIAGNHELSFEDKFLEQDSIIRVRFDPKAIREYLSSRGLTKMREVLVNCTYLEDDLTSVFGLRVYGSPWQPEFHGWAFNLPVGTPLRNKWKEVPGDVDVLITHGPPAGHGDLNMLGVHNGCDELLLAVQRRIRPKFHVFGHIHEGFGVTTDGATTYINASSLNDRYKPVNSPVIFDLPLPPGVTKN